MRAPHRRRLLAARLILGCVFGNLMFTDFVAAAPSTYSGEASVNSQSDGERAEALKTALADVVIRLSGDSTALARTDVARAIAVASKSVLQYQYRRDLVTDAAAAAPQLRLTLVAQFDTVAVDRLLANLGLVGDGSSSAVDTTPSEHRLWISGVHSAVDYARALGYLARHPLVRDAQTTEARADGMLIKVTVIGGFERLLDLIGSEGTLRVNSANPPVEGIDATLALAP